MDVYISAVITILVVYSSLLAVGNDFYITRSLLVLLYTPSTKYCHTQKICKKWRC